VGRRVALTLRRGEDERSVQVRLGSIPDPSTDRQAAAPARAASEDEPAYSE